ncbi:MAG: SDR family oxidoreductase, partial [Planctomycetes bacterium]|nr:SDR family oxidoreductase [Planctomycetota bacterium]
MDLGKMFDISGRTALVTGSSRGIGKGIVMALAQAGAKVAVHCRAEDDNLSETLDEIKSLGGQGIGVTADLSDSKDMESLAHKVKDAIGPIDILVLNASVQSYQTIEDFTTEEFERQYKVNMESSFALIKNSIKHMKNQKWGRILSIGSVNQWKQSPRLPIYSSTKSAMVNLITGCARQYSPYGITANNLAPGVILTDRNRDALKDEEYRQKIMDMIPCGFMGQPEDCAGLALLLCSDAGRY